MKKVSPIIIAVVAVAVIVLGVVLFGSDETTAQESKILVTFSNGSTDRVTVEQIKKFPSKYNGISVELTGRIDKISVDTFNYKDYYIELENGIRLWVMGAFIENSNIDIGDYVSVNGVMLASDYEIKIGKRYDNNSISPLDYITFVK